MNIGNILLNIGDLIPTKPLFKFNIYKKIRQINIKKNINNELNDIRDISLVPTNGNYGHEFWLRRYSGYDENIYAMIEHGIYFGNNVSKVGIKSEWDVGSIITFGKYRQSLLQKLYPQHYIVMAGPLIHYANIDLDYKNKILSQINPNEKTLTAFPPHSISKIKSKYDMNVFVKKIHDIAETLNYKNIIVSIPYIDFESETVVYYKSKGFFIVSGGANPVQFLPRLKAIFSVSDLTISSGLGTHIGYSIHMNKPHIMFFNNITYYGTKKALSKEFDARGKQWFAACDNEYRDFLKAFSIDNGTSITDRQKEMCEYYWGLSKIKNRDEMKGELQKCKEHSIYYQKILK